jgi:uncharacterized membrane protein
MKKLLSPHAARIVFYAPGILLILAALCALIAPRLVLAAVAGFFLFFGFLLCVGAYKLLSFKNKFESLAKELRQGAAAGAVKTSVIPGSVVSGSVIVQRIQSSSGSKETAFIEVDELGEDSDSQHGGRKIILH